MNNAKTAPPRFWTKKRLAAMGLPLIAAALGVISTPTEAATGATLNQTGFVGISFWITH